MSMLIELAIYAALAAGAAFAFHEFEQVYYVAPAEKRGAANQLAADQKVVVQLNTRIENAQADTAACVVSAKTQSDLVDLWRGKAQDNAAQAKALRAQQAKDATAAAPRIAQLQADAAAKPKLMACADELAKAKATLVEALRVRRGQSTPVPK